MAKEMETLDEQINYWLLKKEEKQFEQQAETDEAERRRAIIKLAVANKPLDAEEKASESTKAVQVFAETTMSNSLEAVEQPEFADIPQVMTEKFRAVMACSVLLANVKEANRVKEAQAGSQIQAHWSAAASPNVEGTNLPSASSAAGAAGLAMAAPSVVIQPWNPNDMDMVMAQLN